MSSDTNRYATPSAGGTRFVLATVVIDSMGIGIIIPVLPDLLRELSDLSLGEAAVWGGYLSFVYAAMQFLFGPVIGNLSDRYGRRPVLLISVGVLSIDYLIMGFAPSLWILFIGRALSGIAGATFSTANAYIADTTAPEGRAARFGMVGAAFGLGFVAGPLLGGFAGEIGPRVPFFVASALAAANFLYGLYAMPESLDPANRRAFDLRRANPLGAFLRIFALPLLSWFILCQFLFSMAHTVYPAIWAYYVKEAFAWSNAYVGLSLAVVGSMMALVQGWLIRIVLKRMGETRTAFIGLVLNFAGFTVLGLATQSWIVWAIMPITALGVMFGPALNGMMSAIMSETEQGELQGILSAVMGLTSIISPIIMTQLFGYFTRPDAAPYLPGAPFLLAAVLVLLAMGPLALGVRRIAANRVQSNR